MLPSLVVLYDCVLSLRLERWIGVHDEQVGFRKGKSTLTQLFTIRIIIELAKKSLFISDVSTEKAFDKVSRLLLLKKLIKCGIGCTMLNALKSIYTTTSCVFNLNGKCSSAFRTSCGMRQGEPSSSLLIIASIDDLIVYIRNRCIREPLIVCTFCYTRMVRWFLVQNEM